MYKASGSKSLQRRVSSDPWSYKQGGSQTDGMRIEVLSWSVNWTKRMFLNITLVSQIHFQDYVLRKKMFQISMPQTLPSRSLKEKKKPFWFCSGSVKQRKTILCFVPVWLMNTVISCGHLWDNMNKQLIRTLTVRRISCQQFLLQPSDYHTSQCVQEHKQTGSHERKTNKISADCS